MKVLGVVVLYHPNVDEVIRNISSYLSGLDALVLWNNTPNGGGEIEEIEKSLPSGKLIRMGCGRNVGLGKAYNDAAKYAMDNGFTHLMTMDQDSRFEDGEFETYKESIRKEDNGERVFSPNYVLHGKEESPRTNHLIKVDTTMSSGTVYPVGIFPKTGFFREDYFIDLIDCEFSLRTKEHGIFTYVIPWVRLLHGAGYQKTKHKFLWKTFFPNEYSPVRSYYIIRNGIITHRLYPEAVFWKGYMFYWFYKRLCFVVCYEDNKLAKIKGLLYGLLHGVMGKTGEQTIFK